MLKSIMTCSWKISAPGRIFSIAAAALLASSCGPKNRKIVTQDFAEGRVVDVSIADKLTGNRELLFFSLPRKTQFLEGYIQGIITDYKDNPIQGVVVRARTSGEAAIEEGEGGRTYSVSSFDPGVSDTNGFYKIRFTLPILNNIVNVRGKLDYNPHWEQERDTLGKAYEPQLKQTQFHLYYDRKEGRIIFSEGIRKSVVSPVFSSNAPRAAALPGASQPGQQAAASGEEGKPAGKKDEDMFKGFGFGGP
jgi:hypothetical protein